MAFGNRMPPLLTLDLRDGGTSCLKRIALSQSIPTDIGRG